MARRRRVSFEWSDRAISAVVEDSGCGALRERSCRLVDRLLARLVSRSLDARLAAGGRAESDRLLATRAQYLVSLPYRRSVADNVEHLLHQARLPPKPGSFRVPLRRAEMLAAEDLIEAVVRRLRAPLPVASPGVALVGLLLRDGGGPLYATGARTPVTEVLTDAFAALDPSIPLFTDFGQSVR